MAWSAKIVELDGTVVRTLQKCNIKRYRRGFNDSVGSATITVPKYETGSAVGQYADLTTPGREVQILDGATVRFRGPILRRQPVSSNGDITVEMAGVEWYFGRRFIDAPLRDLLTNGTFAAGTTGWSTSGASMSPEGTTVRRGTGALRVTGGSTWADNYVYQNISYTGTPELGTELTLAGHVLLDSWTGPAFESRMLYMEQLDGGTVVTHNFATIDDDDALSLDTWIRLECTTWVPPVTRTINVRLYAPNGSVVWDEVELVEPVSLAVGKTPEDIATTANRIVQFAQDVTKSKSDLEIATTTPPTTGKTFVFPKAWQFTEHTPVDRALNDEIVPLGVDWDIDPATKTFTLYHPRKGTDRTGSITLALGSNVASYSLDEDGSQVETDVAFLGEGDGPDREEGRAVDTAATSGMVLQGVLASPPGTTIDKLDSMASERLGRLKQLVRVLSVVTYQGAGDLIGTLALGDTVLVDIDDGVVQLGGVWRIVELEVTPRNNTINATLNEDAYVWAASPMTWGDADFTWNGQPV